MAIGDFGVKAEKLTSAQEIQQLLGNAEDSLNGITVRLGAVLEPVMSAGLPSDSMVDNTPEPVIAELFNRYRSCILRMCLDIDRLVEYADRLEL